MLGVAQPDRLRTPHRAGSTAIPQRIGYDAYEVTACWATASEAFTARRSNPGGSRSRRIARDRARQMASSSAAPSISLETSELQFSTLARRHHHHSAAAHPKSALELRA
jgi:hypothetical protein